MPLSKTICRSLKINLVLFAAGIATITSHKALAADKITFEYGIASQSVSFEELETFAKTGTTSPSLKFLFDFSQQNPNAIRWILNQQFPADAKVISDLLNTAPGEYLLGQTSNTIGTRSDRANVKALRGALIAAASNDRQVSLLEVLRNYPTRQVYVNGKILSKTQRDFQKFVREAQRYIKIPAEILQDFLNNS